MNNAESWTIQRILQWSTGYLSERGLSDSPRLDAELLLAHALSVTRIHLYTHFDKPLSAPEREPFKQFFKRRCSGEPVAYIIGQREFMGYTFLVTPAVLIPRPDTEVLVEAALAQLAGRETAGLRILDVGTGSGCIAVSLALKLRGASVTAWDIAGDSLELAAVNAERLGAAVNFQQRDALDAAVWQAGADDRFDLIVSNPPYIGAHEEAELALSVRGFEPRRALFAAHDGLAFYEAFAERAHTCLRPGGRLMVEIGSTQAAAVSGLLASAGWQRLSVLKDYSKLDRVVLAERDEA